MDKTEIVKTFITALQSGEFEVAANYMVDDFTLSGWVDDTLDRGKFLAMQSELRDAMPDFSYNLNDVHEQDDRVESLIQITGTATSDLALPLFGIPLIPATGIAVTLPQVRADYTLTGGKIAQMDIKSVPGGGLAGLLQQLGGEMPILPRIGEFPQLGGTPLSQQIEERNQTNQFGP